MDKKVKNTKCIFMIFLVVYFLITILAIISLISTQEDIVTNNKFIAILKEIWWPIAVIIVSIVIIFLYRFKNGKKIKLAAIIECILGLSMLINTIINIASFGANFMVVFSFLVPMILIYSSMNIFINKQSKKSTTK